MDWNMRLENAYAEFYSNEFSFGKENRHGTDTNRKRKHGKRKCHPPCRRPHGKHYK